jgi:hypothetical protein
MPLVESLLEDEEKAAYENSSIKSSPIALATLPKQHH